MATLVFGIAPTFVRQFTYSNIDAKAVANTLVFTNTGDSQTDFVVTNIVIRCTSATAITVGPTIGIGTSAGTNDIFAPAAILALSVQGKTFGFPMFGMSIIVPFGANIYLNLSTAATGTAETIACDITGYYT